MKNTHTPLLYSCTERMCTITLNRPEKHNALSVELIDALHKAFEKVVDEPTVKVVRLSATGTSFCAGADLSDLRQSQTHTFDDNLRQANALLELFMCIYRCPLPIIAQVQGNALAGGCGLVAVCDVVLASEQAWFGCPEVRIGFIPAMISPFLLRRLGEAQTKALVLSGERIPAKQAQNIGLVNHLHPPHELEKATLLFIQRLIEQNSSHAMQISKNLLNKLQKMSLEEGMQYAAKVNANNRQTDDCQVGVKRFLDKKMQNWHHK